MSKKSTFKNLVIGGVLSSLVSMSSVNSAVIELALVLDGSGSISDSDFSLQTQAYNNIFSNNFYSTFLNPEDSLYVSAYQFSTNVQQEIGFTLIDSDAAAATFGGLFLPISQTDGLTNTAGGVNMAVADLLSNGIGGGAGDKMLIDVSTDGLPNVGSPNGITAAIDAAEAAAAADVTVNAIGVGSGVTGNSFLEDFSEAGDGFFLTADNFEDFEETLQRKIVREITGVDPTDPNNPFNPVDPIDPTIPVIPTNPVDPVNPVTPTNPTNPMNPLNPMDPMTPVVDVPEPTSMMLLGIGMLGLGAARRKKLV